MECKEFDETLLDVAYQTFAVKTSYFDRLGQKIWANAGVENWVQVELIIAFLIRNIPVTTIGKRKRDCDLIINGHAVELRCATTPNSSWLLDAIKKHPKAELYLFLSQTSSKLLNELETYFEKNGYVGKHKMLNEKWLVMVVKKSAKMILLSAKKVPPVSGKQNTDEIRLLKCNKKMHFLRRAREKLELYSRIKLLDWVSVKFEDDAIILQKIEKEKVDSAKNLGEYVVQIDKWGEFKFNNEMLEKVKQMRIGFKEWLLVTFLPERVEIRKK